MRLHVPVCCCVQVVKKKTAKKAAKKKVGAALAHWAWIRGGQVATAARTPLRGLASATVTAEADGPLSVLVASLALRDRADGEEGCQKEGCQKEDCKEESRQEEGWHTIHTLGRLVRSLSAIRLCRLSRVAQRTAAAVCCSAQAGVPRKRAAGCGDSS